MSYTALYRKYRPQTFADVKGQDAIVKTLTNQVQADRIGHAYLFCGTRGTGKTTIAKIFAKAVNCVSPKEGSPCGECALCQAASKEISMNLIEIDAASNNGVENIREIREEVTYTPTEGRYKVYIIDEAHMLSAGAFNALLKTLEEPPSYVIFILATTEAHKIPVTIASRCQRYDFKRIPANTICERMRNLLEEEGIEAEEKALRYIAKAADGAMRDALSLLDQCIAFYLGQALTYDHVLEALGCVDAEVFQRILQKVVTQDVAGVIEDMEGLVAEGRELGQFTIDFTWYLRNLLLLKSSGEAAEVLDLSSEQIASLQEDARQIEFEALTRYIHIFSELSNQMKYASQKRILLEIALIKLCKPQMEQDYHSLAERIRQLEQTIAGAMEKQDVLKRQQDVPKPKEKTKPSILPEAVPEDLKQVVKNWKNVVSSMPGLSRSYLKGAKLTMGSKNELVLVFEDEMAEGYFHREEERIYLENRIAEQIGKRVTVTVKERDTNRSAGDLDVDLEQIIHMEITYE